MPFVPAGTTAEMTVSLSTSNDVAGTPPNVTAVAPVKQSPTNVTVLPPSTGPTSGSMSSTDVTAKYSKSSGALGPASFVSTTFTTPGAFAGETAVSCVSLSTSNEVAGTPPKLTPATSSPASKPEPVIVTVVPPVSG